MLCIQSLQTIMRLIGAIQSKCDKSIKNFADRASDDQEVISDYLFPVWAKQLISVR